VVSQCQVRSPHEFLALLLQVRGHGTPSTGLGFLQTQLIVAQPELSSQRVQIVRFRHGLFVVLAGGSSHEKSNDSNIISIKYVHT
jgi:hypothetical protein